MGTITFRMMGLLFLAVVWAQISCGSSVTESFRWQDVHPDRSQRRDIAEMQHSFYFDVTLTAPTPAGETPGCFDGKDAVQIETTLTHFQRKKTPSRRGFRYTYLPPTVQRRVYVLCVKADPESDQWTASKGDFSSRDDPDLTQLIRDLRLTGLPTADDPLELQLVKAGQLDILGKMADGESMTMSLNPLSQDDAEQPVPDWPPYSSSDNIDVAPPPRLEYRHARTRPFLHHQIPGSRRNRHW